MPLYATRCRICGHEEDIYRPIAEMNDLPIHCGKHVERLISASYVQADIKPYKSMVTGEMITSRSQHRDHLKRHNCYEIGNEVDAHLKTANKPKMSEVDKRRRKAQIATIVNEKL